MKAWVKKMWGVLLGLFALAGSLFAAYLMGRRESKTYVMEEPIDEETIREEAREEIHALSDDDFDARYPGVESTVTAGKDRLRSRIQGVLQPGGSGSPGGGDSEDSQRGDGEDGD